MSKITVRDLPRKFSLASWPAWIQMVVACFVGALFGGYAASTAAISKQEQIVHRQMITGSMDHFIRLGGEIIRQPGAMTAEGTPVVRRLGFYAIDNRFKLQQAVFCGGNFTEVKELDFSPIGVNRVGAGILDGTTLRIVLRHFPQTEYLDVSHCGVNDLTAIQNMRHLKVLKIINNPLEYAEMQAFKQLDSVTELSIGWPDTHLEADSLYRNIDVRKSMLKSISEMKSLKKLILFDMRLRESERKMLEGIEVVNARLN